MNDRALDNILKKIFSASSSPPRLLKNTDG
jgi:hypothetical protein